MERDRYLSITELAKARNTTSETLRHYDRIGLFKPDYVDSATGFRYYALEQYEKLGTILELRRLNLSLEDIQNYFTDRNLDKSINVLKKQYELLCTEISEKLKLQNVLREKLEFATRWQEYKLIEMEPLIKHLPKRYMLTYGEDSKKEKGFCKEYMHLEQLLNEVAPVLAAERMGRYFYNVENGVVDNNGWCPMVFCDNTANGSKFFKEIPEGDYVCLYYHNYTTDFKEIMNVVNSYVKAHKHRLGCNAYEVYVIDIPLTDKVEEVLIEVQFELA